MIDFMSSRVEIDLVKLGNNVEVLAKFVWLKKYRNQWGLPKVVCGIPEIAQVLVNKGIRILADSKIGNLRNMRNAK